MAGNFVFSKGEKSPGMVWYFERKVFRARKNGAVFGLAGFFRSIWPARFLFSVFWVYSAAVLYARIGTSEKSHH